MDYFVTIDCGTTNTRVNIWCDDTVIAQAVAKAGVRDTPLTGGSMKLKKGIKAALGEGLKQAKITKEMVKEIIATGMITSNCGLLELPYIEAPAGIRELAAHMQQSFIPEIWDKPIWFIPGVKNHCPGGEAAALETMDMMRGEEVEAIGLMKRQNIIGNALLILPGSHTKIIRIDEMGRISSCATTLAGELLEVITCQTILADSLSSSFVDTVDQEMVLRGAKSSFKFGLGKTCFSIRVLDVFGDFTIKEKASYLLGAVLASDLLAIKHSQSLAIAPSLPIFVMGKKVLKEAFAVLLRDDPYFTGSIIAVNDQIDDHVSGYGGILIARERGLFL